MPMYVTGSPLVTAIRDSLSQMKLRSSALARANELVRVVVVPAHMLAQADDDIIESRLCLYLAVAPFVDAVDELFYCRV